VPLSSNAKSLARYGQWPRPRYRVARLLGWCATSAAAIALDIVFAEPDRALPLIAREIERDLGVASARRAGRRAPTTISA
jgi:adenylate cyclase